MTLLYHTPLTPDVQSTLGIEHPAPFAVADQVRFSELDVLAHVNNAVYFQWFERVRVLYTQHFGLSRNLGSDDGPRIVLRSGEIHYKQEMLLHEDYVVTCRCTAYRKTSFTMHQELWSGGTQRAVFDCVMVLLQADGSGRYPIPDTVRQHFDTVDGARFEG